MKHNITQLSSFSCTLLLFIFGLTAPAGAQTWQTLGGSVTGGEIAGFSMAIDANETPFVSYQADTAYQSKGTAKKYNGSSWIGVGSPFSNTPPFSTSTAVDALGTPYVAYMSTGSKAAMVKYDGVSWVPVGPASGFSAGGAAYASMALDGSGTPYVVFEDATVNNRATVMKFDGNNWVTVGNAGFSDSNAYTASIAIDGAGTPYVAYADYAAAKKATVKKFDGSTWVTVGSPGFSSGWAYPTTLRINAQGTPYVSYSDAGQSGQFVVMMFDGNNWNQVGQISSPNGCLGSMALAQDGTPYVVYNGQGSTSRPDFFTVKKWDGGNWQSVATGSGGSTTGQFLSFTMAIGNTSVFVGATFNPAPAMTSYTSAMVFKGSLISSVYNLNSSVNKLEVSPNPSKGSFSISYTSSDTKEIPMHISNAMGQTLQTGILKPNTSTDIKLQMPAGIYFLNAGEGKANESVKLIITH